MPLVKLQTSVQMTEEKRKNLLSSLSKVVAEKIGKPEQYVMVTVSEAAVMMSGIAGDAAFLEVRSIGGLNRAVNQAITADLSSLLQVSLGISSERVYINFMDFSPENWGWKGKTFG